MGRKRANKRSITTTISHWGDCVVRHVRGGASIEIIRPDGTKINRRTSEKGKGNRPKPIKYEQAPFPGTDDKSGISINANTHLLVSASDRKEGENTSKSGATMDKKKVR